MEPIASEIKIFLGTLGFNTKHTRVDIKYDRKVGGKVYAHITIDGPIGD